jgi:glycosyltransferase involved in cell wall biosynthesis
VSKNSSSAVVITRNRADILGECLRRLCGLGLFEEILVVDDASTDGTRNVAAQFGGSVHYVHRQAAGGPSAARNAGAALCQSDYIFHFDDDSLVQDASFFEAATRAFSHRNVGLVALPFRNATYSQEVFRIAPDDKQAWAGYSFTACAYAVRASVLREVGGFREYFFYMGEESDLSMRFLDRGLMTAYVKCTPINHMQPATRSTYRADFHGRKNDVLSDFLNIPAPENLYHMLRATVHGVQFGIRNGKLAVSLKGLIAGYAMSWQLRGERNPVSRETFRIFQKLRAYGPRPIDSLRSDSSR